MGRPPCCDKSNVKRGMWTAEEDAKILAYVSTHGTGNWTSVPKKAGLKRCGKSCRLRWTNYLRPDLKHESFTPQEENLIVSLHAAIGSRWSLIADQLPGRTDNDVKNYWNTKLRKKLFEMGIDPVTHKPFSQILADYGSIGGLPKAGIRIGSLNRDLRNAFMVKTEASPVPKETISNITRHSMKAISTPKMEPIQDGLVDSYNNNYSWELLGQLQAIKLVKEASNFTNQENIQAHFFIEGSSSSSSSSNAIQVTSPPPFPCQQPPQLQPTPSSPFSWSEFLQEDAFLPVDPQQQEDFQGLSSTGSSSQMQLQDDIQQRQLSDGGNNIFSVVQDVGYDGNHDIGQGYPGTVRGEASNVIGASSSSDDSFVEGILDGDSEMSWEFPNILDEPFY